MTALIEERQKQQAENEKALDAERARAAELARQADNLQELIAKLEQGLDPRDSCRRARRPAATARPALSALNDPGRLSPAIAFASAQAVPIPVNGVKFSEFGAPDGLGGTEKGLSIATRPAPRSPRPATAGWFMPDPSALMANS